MRDHRRSIAILLALVALLPAAAPAAAQDASPVPSPAAEAEAGPPEYLFAMSGASGTITADTLTLRGVPALIWFTDRPYREAGQVLPPALAVIWPEIVQAYRDSREAAGSNVDDKGIAPNGILSIAQDGDVRNAMIRVTGVVRVTDTGGAADIVLTYEQIEDVLPIGDFGTSSLFITNVIGFNPCERDAAGACVAGS